MANKKLNAVITIGGVVAGSLQSAIGSTTSQLTKVGTEINRVKNSQKKLGEAIKVFGAMGKNVDNLRSRYAATTIELGRLEAAQKRLNRAEKARLTHADKKSALIGQAGKVAAMGFAVAQPFKVAMNFESEMSKVGVLSRGTKAEIKSLEDQARQLGATTTWSATQAAEGMSFLAMAGFKTNDIVGAMPGMLNLASAGALDLGRAADIASNILTGFGMKSNQMGRVADTMTNAFTQSNVTVEMLGETMKYVAPVAASMGVSIEQAAAMAGKLGDAGIQGSMAGTSLRSILSRLAAPPKAAAKAFAQLNIQTQDAKGNLRDVPVILAEIEEKTRSMGNAQRAGIFKAIAGEEAFSSMTELVKQAGTGELQKFTKAMEETGSANRVAKEMMNNTSGKIVELKSAIESVVLSALLPMLPTVQKIITKITEFTAKLDALIKKNPELTKTIITVVLGFVAFKTALVAVKVALWLINSPILKVTGLLARLSAGSSMVAGALNKVKSLMAGFGRGVSTAQSGLTRFMPILRQIGFALTRTPWGAVAVALVAAAVMIYKYWDRIKAFFIGFWEGLKKGLEPVVSTFGELFESMSWLRPVIDLIGTGIGIIYEWFVKLLSPAKATDEQLQSATATGASFGKIVGSAINIVLTPVKLLVDALTWIHGNISGIINKVSALAATSQTISAVHGSEGSIFSKAKDWGYVAGIFEKPSEKMQQAGGLQPKQPFSSASQNNSLLANSFKSTPMSWPPVASIPAETAVSKLMNNLALPKSEQNIQHNVAPQQQVPQVAMRGTENVTAPQQTFSSTYTIQIESKSGQSEKSIADEVMRQLNQNQRKQAAQQRSTMIDWGYAQ